MAAVLLGFHNPIEVAEQLATLQNLYPKRVLCGFAKGGPFESQNAVFKTDKNLSRDRMLEALPAVLDLFTKPKASHQGQYYQWQDVELEPRASIQPQDFYLASSDPVSIELAGRHQMGLMAAQFWPLEKIASNIQQYLTHSNNQSGEFMAARGVFIADHQDDAHHQAWLHIQGLRSRKSQLWGANKKGPMTGVEPEVLLGRMLVGTPDEVLKRLKSVVNIGVNHLALNPLTANHQTRIEQLMWFQQEARLKL